jgi:hypothetical protein
MFYIRGRPLVQPFDCGTSAIASVLSKPLVVRVCDSSANTIAVPIRAVGPSAHCSAQLYCRLHVSRGRHTSKCWSSMPCECIRISLKRYFETSSPPRPHQKVHRSSGPDERLSILHPVSAQAKAAHLSTRPAPAPQLGLSWPLQHSQAWSAPGSVTGTDYHQAQPSCTPPRHRFGLDLKS